MNVVTVRVSKLPGDQRGRIYDRGDTLLRVNYKLAESWFSNGEHIEVGNLVAAIVKTED